MSAFKSERSTKEVNFHVLMAMRRYATKKFHREGIRILTRHNVERVERVRHHFILTLRRELIDRYTIRERCL